MARDIDDHHTADLVELATTGVMRKSPPVAAWGRVSAANAVKRMRRRNDALARNRARIQPPPEGQSDE